MLTDAFRPYLLEQSQRKTPNNTRPSQDLRMGRGMPSKKAIQKAPCFPAPSAPSPTVLTERVSARTPAHEFPEVSSEGF